MDVPNKMMTMVISVVALKTQTVLKKMISFTVTKAIGQKDLDSLFVVQLIAR